MSTPEKPDPDAEDELTRFEVDQDDVFITPAYPPEEMERRRLAREAEKPAE